MDILHLVDRLEELFNESRPIWFTHSVIMDEDRLLDIIDQMRVSIPEEIKKSQQMIRLHSFANCQAWNTRKPFPNYPKNSKKNCCSANHFQSFNLFINQE